MEQIRVGIAGLGRSGWGIHARLLADMPERYTVTAVVDGDAARRDEAVDEFDCVAYESYADLLADPGVELIIVALPNHLHADASIDALAAGKHAVSEKPMATSLADADRMVAAAQNSDKLLSIFQNRRYSPDFVKVRSLIESGMFGRIVQINMGESKFSRRWDWQTLRRFGGGTLNNTGPHYLDQALQLFGPAEPEVLSMLDRTLTLGDADDHVKILLTAEGAPTIDIELSSCNAYPREVWNVMGTQGGLTGGHGSLRWRWFDPAELPARELDLTPTENRSYNRDEIPWQEGRWSIDEDDGPGHGGFYNDLADSIRNGKPPVITAESVRRVIKLQEQCHAAAGF